MPRTLDPPREADPSASRVLTLTLDDGQASIKEKNVFLIDVDRLEPFGGRYIKVYMSEDRYYFARKVNVRWR